VQLEHPCFNHGISMKAPLHRVGRLTLALWGLFLGVLFVALALWYFYSPSVVKVAVVRGADASILRALAEVTKPNQSLEIRIIEFSDYRSAAEALEEGKVDAATVQPDVLFPRNGATLAILREENLIIAATGRVDDLTKLSGKRIAIVSRGQADLEVLEQVLRYYRLDIAPTEITRLSFEQLNDRSGLAKADAVVFMAQPSAAYVPKILDVVSAVLGTELNILPLEGSNAFVAGSPGVAEATLQTGSLKGRPPLPKEETKTLSTSTRLVAAVDLDRSLVARLTEQLFQRRQWIARTVPEANFMEAPDDDKAMSARLPNHRGAIDYFNREQQTFMDLYGDWLWLFLFAAGGLSSIAGWLAQTLARKRREAVDEILGRLLTILSDARETKSSDELRKLTLETDKLVARAVRQTRRKTTSTATMSALMLSIDAARHAIEDRRQELNGKKGAIAAARG
jgi:TRAP-type uncharacterized transport system substrate-binding protein